MKSVHILGVGGTLMGAFAAFLKRKGIQVSGSDQKIYPPMSDVLQEAGVHVFEGYSPENLSQLNPSPDIVVIGNVIRRDNPEAQAAMSGDYQTYSLPEMMEKFLLQQTRNIVCSGTHGKTTTSSLMAHVLVSSAKDPSYFIGGVCQSLPHSFHVTDGKFFVLEGDEYDSSFWDKVPKFNHYLPDDVILTSVEFDHADIYKDLEAILSAFRGLVDRIRPGGRLIACVDYPNVQKMISLSKVPVISYGLHLENHPQFRASDIQVSNENTTFSILENEKKVGQIEIPLVGNHNVLNALAVWIEATQVGISPQEVSKAFLSFRGVKRRQEVRGEIRGVTVIDDFAHHPTAVKTTLEGLRLKYPGKRLVTLFEPRSATSRRNIFQKEYAVAFGSADLVYIAKPYDQSLIDKSQRFSSSQLVEDLRRQGLQANELLNVDELLPRLIQDLHSGDVVAVLSNGGFDGLIPRLLDELKK